MYYKIYKKDIEYTSLQSPVIQSFYNNVEKLYGSHKSFLKITVTIDKDTYTKNNSFKLLIPTLKKPSKKVKVLNIGVKKLGQDLIKSLKKYYTNLASLYGEISQSQKELLTKLSKINSEITKTKSIDINKLKSIFGGEIIIEDIGMINFID